MLRVTERIHRRDKGGGTLWRRWVRKLLQARRAAAERDPNATPNRTPRIAYL